MKTWPFESNVLLAGLTRGLWMGAPADRCQEHRGTLAGASSRRSPPASGAEADHGRWLNGALQRADDDAALSGM